MIPALLVYGAAVLLVGLFAARRATRSAESFLLGDRSFGFLPTWAGLTSTVIGGSTTLVLASLVAEKGLPGAWLDVAGALGLLGLGLFLARRVRETGEVTLAAVVGRFYGPRVRKIAAVLVVLAEIVWFALLAQATETVVSSLTSWPPTPVLVGTALLFVSYTALGGQRAVLRTDLLQLGLMVVGIVGVALPLALASLAQTGWPRPLLSFPVSDRFGWTDVAALLVLVGLPHAVGSDVWAKLLSARDAATARRAALGAAAAKLVFGAAVVVIAFAGVALEVGGAPQTIFPATVRVLAGPLLSPLLLVALVATMQASADSVLLSAAAATSHDLLGGAPARTSRLLVVAYGALGLFVALGMRDVLATFRLGYAIFASSLILPTLVAFAPRVALRPRFAGAAMLLGGATTLCATLLGSRFDPVLVGTAVNALVLLPGLSVRGAAREAAVSRER
ncbi:MAG: sodium:solute symporter family protein [Thermoanaerobaculia bacterium]